MYNLQKYWMDEGRMELEKALQLRKNEGLARYLQICSSVLMVYASVVDPHTFDADPDPAFLARCGSGSRLFEKQPRSSSQIKIMNDFCRF